MNDALGYSEKKRKIALEMGIDWRRRFQWPKNKSRLSVGL